MTGSQEALVEIKTNPQDEATLISQVSPLVQAASDLVVTDENAPSLGLKLKGLREAKKVVNVFFDPPIQKIRDALNMMTDRKKSVLAPMDKAMGIINSKGLVYTQAKRKAEEEAANARRKAQEKAEEENRLAQAELAESAGEPELAEQIVNTPAPVSEPVKPKVEKIKGMSFKKKWAYEVTDNVALVEAVLEKIRAGVLPSDIIEVKTTFLNSQCRMLKDKFAKAYAGTRCWPEETAGGSRM